MAEGGVARGKLLETVRGSLAAGGFSQRPELDADAAAEGDLAFSGGRS
jgi:hypothetical protein